MHAARGDGRVDLAHLGDRRGGRAEHVRGVGREPRGLLRQAQGDRGVHRALGTDLEVRLGVRGVDRAGGGLPQAHPAVVGVPEVVDGPAREGLRRVAVPLGVQRVAVLERRDQGEGLEDRAGLHARLGGVVARLRHEVLAAVHAPDRPRGGIHRDRADAVLRRAVLGEVLDGLDGVVLDPGVDRGDDREAAGVDLVLGESFGDELGAHLVQQVALVPGQGVLALWLDGVGELERLGVRRGHLPDVDLPRDHAIPQLDGLLLVHGGVIGGGAGDHGHEQRGLRVRHVRGVLAEVGLRGLLHAVGAAAEVDRVQVARQDLVLVELLVDLQSHDRFLGLAHVGGLAARVVPLHVLHGDRGAALAGTALEVVDQGSHDAARGDAAVLVEGGVLARDDRILDVLRDLVGVELGAVDLAERPHLGLAVGVVDPAGLGEGEVGGFRDGGVVVEPDGEAESGEDHERHRAHDQAQRGEPAPRVLPARPRVVQEVRRGDLLRPTFAGRGRGRAGRRRRARVTGVDRGAARASRGRGASTRRRGGLRRSRRAVGGLRAGGSPCRRPRAGGGRRTLRGRRSLGGGPCTATGAAGALGLRRLRGGRGRAAHSCCAACATARRLLRSVRSVRRAAGRASRIAHDCSWSFEGTNWSMRRRAHGFPVWARPPARRNVSAEKHTGCARLMRPRSHRRPGRIDLVVGPQLWSRASHQAFSSSLARSSPSGPCSMRSSSRCL